MSMKTQSANAKVAYYKYWPENEETIFSQIFASCKMKNEGDRETGWRKVNIQHSQSLSEW